MFLYIKSNSKASITKIAHHKNCCPSSLFSFIKLVIITLTLHILENKNNNNDILKGIGIITREFYTIKFGFEVLGDNIKVYCKQG